MYNEIIYLADEIKTGKVDEYGDPVCDLEMSQLFAKKKSISQTEFYQAQTSDYKPEIKFKIPDYMDYGGQKFLVHEDVKYKIMKVYQPENSEELEITCYGGVRDVNAAIGDENN